MNSYSNILRPAKSEIEEFAARPSATHLDDAWFATLIQRVDRIITAPGDSLAERDLDALGWMLADSGPVGEGFGPSINTALEAMQRARKKRFKNKRKAEQDVPPKSDRSGG